MVMVAILLNYTMEVLTRPTVIYDLQAKQYDNVIFITATTWVMNLVTEWQHGLVSDELGYRVTTWFSKWWTWLQSDNLV